MKLIDRFKRCLFFAFVVCMALIPVFAQNQTAGEKPSPKAKPPLPLPVDRKIQFTTSEGTWMSLDVSPDGKTFIFDLLGDIYTLPVGGGQAAPVLTGLAFESQPRYSPDGGLIAFVSDRDGANNLWIAKPDGSDAKQLSKEKQAEYASPVWTPDGQYVLVSMSAPATLGAYELWMFHKLGGTGVKISKGEGAAPNPENPTPGPSDLGPFVTSETIYYAQQAPRTGPRFEVPATQLFKRNLNTGDEGPITFSHGQAFSPVVSPDGKTLVFGSRYEGKTGLRVRNIENGNERWLKYPVQRDELESRPTRGLLPGYAFTPDGEAIVLSYEGKIKKVAVKDGRETVIPFSAEVSLDAGPSLYRELKLDEGPVRARLIQEPEISTDGTIAFSALAAVYTIKPGTPAPVRLTRDAEAREFQPSWSPDGKRLTYVSWSTRGGHIWISDLGGDTPLRVTSLAAFYRDPVFTPDGKYVVALSTPHQTRVNHPSDFLAPQPGLDIIRIPAAGGRAELIVPSRGLGKPHFGPELDRVYVYGNKGLISYRFDGSDPRTHLRVVGKGRGPVPNPATDVRISPDGTYALARFRNGQLFVLSVPKTGAGGPTVNIASPSVPLKRLTTIGADSFGWAADGKTIVWTVGSTVYRRELADISFETIKMPESAQQEAASGVETAKADPPVDEESKAEALQIKIERERHVPQGISVLRGAKVITMRGKEIIENADIVVRNNRIADIGAKGTVAIPRDARVFDFKGKVIIPGLVDIHAHWEVRHSVLDTQDYTFLGNLAYGVTTGRDPQTSTNDTFAYQDLVDTGQMIGPRVFTTGPGIFADTDFQSYEEAKKTVERYQGHYRAETLKSYLVGNRQQRQWVVMASKELGIIPTTEGGSNFGLNLTHAIDGFSGNEHALPVVPIYDDVVQLFAKTGITYTPTLVVAYGGPQGKFYFFEKYDIYGDAKLRRFNPQAVLDEKTARLPFYRDDEYIFPRIAAGAGEILKKGGRIGLGGHGELQGLQCHWEMWGLKMGGMDNHDVLRVATILGAEAIGYGKEFGSLEKGKLADLIVLDKDPLTDIRNTNSIGYVMKNGELYQGDTLDMIYPEQRKLPEMWWWSEKPDDIDYLK